MLARDPSFQRKDADAAFADDELRVVPGVRGCIWTVRGADSALALQVASGLARKRTVRDLEKAESSADEAAAVGREILRALAEKPMGTHELAKALPEGVVRSLGAPGKRIGLSTTLPPSIRLLEFDGRVRRRPVGLRVEAERYDWELATVEQRVGPDASECQAEQAVAMARRYFEQAGPATLDEFANYTGFGKRLCRSAIAEIGVVSLHVDGLDGEFFVLPEHAGDVSSVAPVSKTDVHLLATLDNYLMHRRDPGRLLVAPEHQDRETLAMTGHKMIRLGDSRWSRLRPIISGGEWLGSWGWDPDTAELVWGTLSPVDDEVRAAIETKASLTAAFITEQLDGAARTNSIDGEKGRNRRLAYIASLNR